MHFYAIKKHHFTQAVFKEHTRSLEHIDDERVTERKLKGLLDLCQISFVLVVGSFLTDWQAPSFAKNCTTIRLQEATTPPFPLLQLT